jgi:hypothetical protein
MNTDLFCEKAKKTRILQGPLLNNTCLMVYLIMSGATLNLWKLKSKVSAALSTSKTLAASHHRRIIRFLSKGEAIRTKLLALNYALLEDYHNEKYLILDGTIWKTQRYEYNFQTLALLVNGRSIPIWFKDLMRVGASCTEQRKALFKDALEHLNLKGKVLLADREYIGVEWIKFLTDNAIGFTIRMKEDVYKKFLPKGISMGYLNEQANRHGKWSVKMTIHGHEYTYIVVACDGKFFRLLTTEQPQEALASYRLRYRIETMFKHLKSNGFNMEDMHLVREDRCNTLVCCMMLAYTMTICYDQDGYAVYLGKVAHKKIKDRMSAFIWGRDRIGVLLGNLEKFIFQTDDRFGIWQRARLLFQEVISNNTPDNQLVICR